MLACEACHGPLVLHVKGGAKIANAVIERDREACLVCHRMLLSRPKRFRQIQETAHHQAGADKGKACLDCHNPHAPRA